MKVTNGASFNPVSLPKAQTTVARCFSVIDIGTVESFYNNQPTGPKRYLYITWELPKLLTTFNEERGPEPFVVGLEVTASTDTKSNFSKLISNWRGKPLTSKEETDGFDPTVMIGKTAAINFIIATKSKYKKEEIDKVTSENSVIKFNGIMQKPQEMVCPKAINETFVWDWDIIAEGKEKFDEGKFGKIPKFIQKKMITSEEFRKYGKFTGSTSSDETEDNEPEEDTNEEVTEGTW